MPIGGDTDVAPDIDAEPDAGDDPDIEADSQDGGPDAADSDAELRDEDAPDAPDAPDSPDAPDGEADAPDGDTASDPRLDGPDESDGDVDATADTDTDADTDSDAEIDDSLAIVGGWVDEHGTAHTITEEDWEQVRTGDVTYAYEITIFWPADEYLIAYNKPGNPTNETLWSRFDWVWEGDELYVCHVTETASIALSAIAAPDPDGSEPSVGGCNGAAWIHMTP